MNTWGERSNTGILTMTSFLQRNWKVFSLIFIVDKHLCKTRKKSELGAHLNAHDSVKEVKTPWEVGIS